jgi:hypothetical protein
MDAQLEFRKTREKELALEPQNTSQNSSLLQRLKTQKSTVSNESEQREYRLVTGGEDGQIIWWNFTADYLN